MGSGQELYASGKDVMKMFLDNAQTMDSLTITIDTVTKENINTALADVCDAVNNLQAALANQSIVKLA